MKPQQEGNQERHRHLVQAVSLLRHYQLAGKDGQYSLPGTEPVEVTTTDIDLSTDLLEAVICLEVNSQPMMGKTRVFDPQKHQSTATTESLGEK